MRREKYLIQEMMWLQEAELERSPEGTKGEEEKMEKHTTMSGREQVGREVRSSRSEISPWLGGRFSTP